MSPLKNLFWFIFFKKWNNKSKYLHNFCNLKGTKNILENMLCNEVHVIQYSAFFHCLKNLSSVFQMYMGTGSFWILWLRFEFLVVPLIFRVCWWKAIERFIPLLLVFKALSAVMPMFWHPFPCWDILSKALSILQSNICKTKFPS